MKFCSQPKIRVLEGKSFELKPFKKREDQITITDTKKKANLTEGSLMDSSQQSKTNPVVFDQASKLKIIIFTIKQIRDSSDAFHIEFAEEVEYQNEKLVRVVVSKE
ncbi:1940_t:CDS:2 [Gigaspora margarita]|uniref:1940_t:CDS:1 n=1 Tax=Gigaspora margarita TaxID=4874 RepID=A0ABN7V4V0_GIGMA|nr:1940_t:CDS:2 [Gigaspora margarita]